MASRTISFDYKENGIPTNAYSVTLSSEDATYGIRELELGTVIVADATAVDNPSTGRYEYTFDATNGVVYEASWKLVPADGDSAAYTVEIIGPYDTGAEAIEAVTDFRGNFMIGTLGTLMLKITDFDGIPHDPIDIYVTVETNFGGSGGSGTVIDEGVPEKATVGFYIFDWEILATESPGEYRVIWEYTTADGISRVEVQNIVVVDDGTDTVLYSGVSYELRLALEHYLSCAQSIPVYFEQAKPSVDNKKFRFTFPRWNQTAGVKIYRNGNEIVTSDIEIDYFKGEVNFKDALTSYDMIAADYNFRWFSAEELNQFIVFAIEILNTYPPHSNYHMGNIAGEGARFIPGVIEKAATDALRKLMFCLQFQQPQQVFGGPNGAQKAFSNLETLKKNYEEEWKLIFENKKLGPYVGLTQAVVVPTYTLPGGRSRWFRYLFSN